MQGMSRGDFMSWWRKLLTEKGKRRFGFQCVTLWRQVQSPKMFLKASTKNFMQVP